MNTLVLQSTNPDTCPEWIEQCLSSVRGWCEKQGFEWRFLGDELFDPVPGWYMEKTGKGPVAADYARLVAMQTLLAGKEWDRVIWLDADVLVLDNDMVLSTEKSCAFGQEVWVQQEDKGLKARKNVHNAVCVFHQGCAVLPFLVETVASIIQRADPDRIAPQMVGPKLLSALHALYDFALLPQVGALSQEVVSDICDEGGPALDLLKAKSPVPLQAVNLCASLMKAEDGLKVLARASDLLGN